MQENLWKQKVKNLINNRIDIITSYMNEKMQINFDENNFLKVLENSNKFKDNFFFKEELLQCIVEITTDVTFVGLPSSYCIVT